MAHESYPVNPANPVHPVDCLGAWLEEMAACPLPGAVSAAAVAAAMGAALVAKVARLALLRMPAVPELEAVSDLARTQQRELLLLADADVQAYQAVLDTRSQAAGDAAWRARRAATEVPIRMAEACAALQDRLSALEQCCPRSVRIELATGASLLEAGRQAGLLGAEENLKLWAESEGGRPLRLRLDALKESKM